MLLILKWVNHLKFQLMSNGKEAPKVQLTKDGKEVKFTSVEGTRHVYSVAEVKPEHQGVYKLTAKNKTSSEETSVTLNVTCKIYLFFSALECNNC